MTRFPIAKAQFPRTVAALADLFLFVERYFEDHHIDVNHRFSVDFAVEEIFTNMITYHPEGRWPISIEMVGDPQQLQIVLVDRDVDPFDIADARQVDTTAALADRKPGGLGIQLTYRLMDRVDYEYADGARRITLTKNLPAPVREPDVRD